ncbi:MAG: acetate--CoA ligase family protein [Bacteroidales bacterium]|jgi:acetyltransferase
MINQKLIDPRSIVVVGGSDDITKPGGKVLKNIIDGKFRGKLCAVNPKAVSVQGVVSFRDINLIPDTDLAILAIPAKLCPEAVEVLAGKKKTSAFIILSAGFGEENQQGKILEKQIVDIIDRYDGCLIGPNCIGFLNTNYNGVFTTPLPVLSPQGADLISGSGATAVFIMESAIPAGLSFASVFSVGNSAQIGVEDVIEYLDINYVPGESSPVKLLYIENIDNPGKLLEHSASLIRKGCRIAAIKSGSSEAGSRAASSHTGALASSDASVDALFRKAGIVRCYGRLELAAIASLFMLPVPKGRRMGIVTHAGGPAVMLTDVLSKGGLEIPEISGADADNLRSKLFPGSSVSNPIDFLATGTAEQLGTILDACENDFENIDSVAVIFGSPGLFPVADVYNVLDKKMHSCKKPIYPILPSVINARKDIDAFISKGNVFFPDEVVFGSALVSVMNTAGPAFNERAGIKIKKDKIREIIKNSSQGYLEPSAVAAILDASGIPRPPEGYADDPAAAGRIAAGIGFPVVMKVVGPVHKSDVGGVTLNIHNVSSAENEFSRLMKIPGAKSVLIQKMLKGTEFFAGAAADDKFGHLIMAGLGGIFIEVLRDVSSGLVPVTGDEAQRMVRSLKSYDIIKGTRGKEGISEAKFIEIICRLSSLLEVAPEIEEMDLNPLIGTADSLFAADARIKIGRAVRQ